MSGASEITHLSIPGCRSRQTRLIQRLSDLSLDAALLCDRRHVYYLTGYWHIGRPMFECAALLRRDGRCTLFAHSEPANELAVDDIESFETNHHGTIIDDQASSLITAIKPYVSDVKRMGYDRLMSHTALPDIQLHDLRETMWSLRRTKDPDELLLLRGVLAAGDAAYARAYQILRPGMTEVQLYAQMCAAAIESAGEPIVEFGNDFQVGSMGGPPRSRPAEAGETAILDVGVVVRGYSGDACRTFIVGAEPTDEQAQAHRLVMDALAYVESVARPGASCREMHEEVTRMIDGKNGWQFPHHLGHGIGLSAHEAPRLNRHWNDTLQPGDVFTAEPGLYSDELSGGVRVENVYHVTDTGIECLTPYPTALRSTPQSP